MAQTKKPGAGKVDPKPDDAGGDGGDGGGDDGEQPMSRDDVVKLVNGAIKSHLGRTLGPAIEAGLAPIVEQLKALKPAENTNGEGDGAGAGDGEADDKKKPDPVMMKLQKQQQKLERELADEKQARAAADTARKDALRDNELGRALDVIGVDKLRLRGALAVHRGAAFVDDAGGVKYKVKRDGYDEDLEVAEALKEWAATDEGKSYLAPTGATGGSGARAPRTSGGRAKPAAGTAEAKAVNQAEAATALVGFVDQMTGGGGSFPL